MRSTTETEKTPRQKRVRLNRMDEEIRLKAGSMVCHLEWGLTDLFHDGRRINLFPPVAKPQ